MRMLRSNGATLRYLFLVLVSDVVFSARKEGDELDLDKVVIADPSASPSGDEDDHNASRVHLNSQPASRPQSPHIGPIRWKTYPGKCMDVIGGSTRNGNHIGLFDCFDVAKDAHVNQQFIAPPGGVGPIRWHAHPNKCIDVAGGAEFNGNNIVLFDCLRNGTHPNQQFVLPPNGVGPIRWATHMNTCMDVMGGGNFNLNRIGLYECLRNGSHPNMQFELPLLFGVPEKARTKIATSTVTEKAPWNHSASAKRVTNIATTFVTERALRKVSASTDVQQQKGRTETSTTVVKEKALQDLLTSADRAKLAAAFHTEPSPQHVSASTEIEQQAHQIEEQLKEEALYWGAFAGIVVQVGLSIYVGALYITWLLTGRKGQHTGSKTEGSYYKRKRHSQGLTDLFNTVKGWYRQPRALQSAKAVAGQISSLIKAEGTCATLLAADDSYNLRDDPETEFFEVPEDMSMYERWSVVLDGREASEVPRDELSFLVYSGTPSRYRHVLWPRWWAGPELGNIEDLQHQVDEESAVHIDHDLNRTLPGFLNDEQRRLLRRTLRAYANRNPDVGYCQGMCFLACVPLLLAFGESHALASLRFIIEDVCPGYHGPQLDGFIRDLTALSGLISFALPDVHRELEALEMPLHMLATDHLLTLSARTWPLHAVVRLWDIVLFEGSPALLASFLAMLHIYFEKSVAAARASADDGGDPSELQIDVACRFKEMVRANVCQDIDKVMHQTRKYIPTVRGNPVDGSDRRTA